MLKILAVTTIATALYAIVTGLLIGWSAVPLRFAIALISSTMIGTAAALVLPPMAHRLSARSPTAAWLGIAAALTAIAVPGSLLSGALAQAFGLVERSSFWAVQREGFGITLVMTLTIGIGISIHERTRARLDEAREKLRAQELEAERARRLAADARLASLESRLHPHFLFNAIAAISGEIREAPEHAERLLGEFADLLRASLDSSGRHVVPLRDEVAVVQAYLEIEKARLGERLRVKLDVPDELEAWPVPPFALHTLVQNSVKHVAAARPEGAEIRVSARRHGERLELSVWDDGPGIDPSDFPPGHGLDTLRSRLAVLFGAQAGLDARRQEGGGQVTMALPARDALGQSP
jgi:sensor histidine kinase YesM